MINFLYRYTGALSKCLLSLLILLAWELTYQPCCPHWADAATSTAAHLLRQPGRDPGSTPDTHCHRRVYLMVDKRYDLKPVLFLPVPLFRLVLVPVEHPAPADVLSAELAAGAVRLACLRGPPSL